MAGPVWWFALGSSEDPRSLCWSVRTKDDELRLAASPADGPVELTAYPTGRWRVTVGGVVSRWFRPPEFRPGWVRGPDVLLGGHSAPPEPGVPVGSVRWLNPPNVGQLARIQLWFANPYADEGKWWSALPRSTERIEVFLLRRAGSVHIVRDDEPVDPDDQPGPPLARGRGVAVRTDSAGRLSLRETVI